MSGTSVRRRHTKARRRCWSGTIHGHGSIQEAFIIELRIEHKAAALNNCTRTRRCLTAGIHKVTGLAVTLSAGANGSEEKSVFPNRFIV